MNRIREGEATALMLLAVGGWSFPGVFVHLMPHMALYSIGIMRLSVACLTLLPLALMNSRRAGTIVAFRSWRCWLLAFSMLIYYLVATAAFMYAPIGEVALLIASAPLFAVIIRAVLGHPVTRAEGFGAVLAVSGVAVMAGPDLLHARADQSGIWIGAVFSLAAAFAAATYAIGGTMLHTRGESVSPVSQALLTFCLGFVLLPLAIFDPKLDLSRPNFWWILPLGMLSTAMPTVFYAATAKRVSSVLATMINPLTAICANVVATLTVHEVPHRDTVLGGVLVVSGVFLSTRR